MSGDIKSLKSYLVSLGFDANMGQYLKFESALKDAGKLVKKTTFEMGVDLLKWQTAVTGLFLGTSTAIVGTIAKVALADQDFRLFGQRMFLTTAQARSLKISLDALGQPIEAIAFDPELHSRYEQLRKDQLALAGGLGGDFEGTMKQVRDVIFEFTRLEVEFKYFTFSVAKNLFKALGGGDFIQQLHSLNDWVIKNIPNWSDKFAKYLVPILKDTWRILKDTGIVLLDLATIFTNFVAIISGDSSLKGSTFSFDKFANAIDKTANAVAWLLEKLIGLEQFIAGNAGLFGGVALGAKVGSFFGPEGTFAGGAIGGLLGLGYDSLSRGPVNAGRGSSGAGTYGLSDIVRGVIGVESRGHQTDAFGRTLTSSAGALGLMQLMPGTATSLGVDPNNAQQNVAGGTAYLQQLYAKYGNWDQALEAYNWGPGNLDKALKNGTAIPSGVQAYATAVERRAGIGGGSNGSVHNSFTVGDINIMQPNATPEQIRGIVKDSLVEHSALSTKRSLAQTRTIYG